MIVRIRDAAKLMGISIITCCAVLVCTMFLNFYLDITQIETALTTPQEMMYYTAQVSTAKVVCSVSGGCLLATSVVMLLFYVKHYIDTHKKELGILKALGYSSLKIAVHFWVFGTSILLGTAGGFAGAFLLMPQFYRLQNKDHFLPKITIQFHPLLALYLICLPSAAFAALSIFYAFCQLRTPALALIKGNAEGPDKSRRISRRKNPENAGPFLPELKRNTLRSRKTLVFFIVFASFCFSSMTQMSASMKKLSSIMMGIMTLAIGIILACTTLFLAITTVVKGNVKTIAMMRVFGYSQRECSNALLHCYRPASYLGFALGTIYQYGLLRLMVDIVFRDFEMIPAYTFDFPVMFLSLGCFLVLYETTTYCYSRKLGRISIKEIMLE